VLDTQERFLNMPGADVLVNWINEQIAVIAAEGKIPKLKNRRQLLVDKEIGLDSLVNFAGRTLSL